MPRDKKTEPATIDADSLPELTPQQQEFVRHVLAGKTSSDAYRAAYNTENMAPNSIWREASLLASHKNVAQWLSAARQACLGTHVVTLQNHQQQLERLREAAMQTGNYGAAVQAELARGKVAGHHIERIQEIPADVTDTLKTIAQHQPDLAATLAAAHGIPWGADEHATKH
jgi:phage terminase small subunit